MMSKHTKHDEPIKKKKKKVVEEEPVKKKKKATDVSTKVLNISTRNDKGISKLDAGGLATILGGSAEQIQQLLEVGNNDSASALLNKRLLQTLVDLIPHAEENVRNTKGQRGVYQINSLITSVRELLSDLQASKDRGAIGDSLVERVVRPTFLDIGMALAQEEQNFASYLRDQVTPEQFKTIRAEHRVMIQRIALVINRKYEEAKSGTIAFLQS